jgi:ACR3 family arsenite transporter
MMTIPIFVNIVLVFGATYVFAKIMKLGYVDAAPAAIVAGSNHFEVAIAVAATLFGLTSGAALATVVGVLTEVPLMLFIVWLCKRTMGFFGHIRNPPMIQRLLICFKAEKTFWMQFKQSTVYQEANLFPF